MGIEKLSRSRGTIHGLRAHRSFKRPSASIAKPISSSTMLASLLLQVLAPQRGRLMPQSLSHETWKSVSTMKRARDALGVAALHDQLYAVGGGNNHGLRFASVESFNPATGVWSSAPNMAEARSGLGVAVHADNLYAIGGRGASGEVLNSAERFDGKAWHYISAMATKRRCFGVGVIGGLLYAVGGRGGKEFQGQGHALSSVEIYDTSKGTWVDGPSMLTPRESLAVAVFDDKLYAIGGIDETGEFLDTVEVFDPLEGEWAEVQHMNVPRATHSAAVVDGLLYVVGGGDSSVEYFNPSKNLWSRGTSFHAPSFGLAVGEIHGSLYAVGGFAKGDAVASVHVLSHNSKGKWDVR